MRARLAGGAGLTLVLWLSGCTVQDPVQWPATVAVTDPPTLDPELAGRVLPPNLAAPNFRVVAPGRECVARLSGTAGTPVVIAGRPELMRWPAAPWRDLLAANRGATLKLEVAVREVGDRWRAYAPVLLTVAAEDIDRYLTYRLLTPLDNVWSSQGLFQRDLTSYTERVVLHSRQMENGCVNCHSFAGGRGDVFHLAIRSKIHGTGGVLSYNGRLIRLKAKTGYPAWHPSGRLLVFSANEVRQWFHPARADTRDVLDLSSGLCVLDPQTLQVTTVPKLAEANELVTWPTWSADGRWLYFCWAKAIWPPDSKVPPANYDQCRYGLGRVAYDLDRNAWGSPQLVLSPDQLGLSPDHPAGSAALPRLTPDGRFVLFCRCDYGCFPVHHVESDLYRLELATGRLTRLECNSDRCESWFSLSSNGRWLVLSSKRRDGLFVRPYLSYLNAEGQASEPLLLPQADPGHYDALMTSYNRPELLVTPVRYASRRIAGVVRDGTPQGEGLPEPFGESKDPPWRAAGSGGELPR